MIPIKELSFDESRFVDKNLFNAANGCIKKMETDTSYVKGTMENKILDLQEILLQYFSDIDLSTLNEKKILKIYDSMDMKKIKIFNYLWVYLSEEKLLSPAIALRILYFKDRLQIYWEKEDVPYILTNPIFDTFTEEFPVCNKRILQLFFKKINPIINDSKMELLIIDYFENIKLNKAYTISSRVTYCSYFTDISKVIFNTSLDNLTESYFIKLLSGGNYKTKIVHIIPFLYYLSEKGLLKDDRLNTIVRIVFSNFSPMDYANRFLKYLENPYIDRFFMVSKPHSSSAFKISFAPPIDSDFLYDVIKDYAVNCVDSNNNTILKTIINEFELSLQGLKVDIVTDFNLNTFKTQLSYFKNRGFGNKGLNLLCGVYLFIMNNYDSNIFEDDGLSGNILLRRGLGSYLNQGYDLIAYNLIEEVPISDKWILNYCSNATGNLMNKTLETIVIDFTLIKNRTFRYWYKLYIWKGMNDLYSKIHMKSQVITFLNYIDDLKTGKELSIYVKPNKADGISVNEIIAYKNYILNTQKNNRTRNGYIYNPRSVLKFIQDNGVIEFPNGIFYYLTNALDTNYNNTKAIPNEELAKISALMKEKAKTDTIAEIYYLIFYIALETEFRPSQVFTLEIDCVQETAKSNEYVLISKTKTSNGEKIEQPITIYTKRHIYEIIKLTQSFRENCPIAELKKYLFIIPCLVRGNSYQIISNSIFNNYFQVCCEELQLPNYSFANLRDTHMTKAEEFVIRNQLSDMEQNILSGHRSPNVGNKHYIDTQIKDLLESVHGIIIGDVDVKGKIKEYISPDITTDENTVSDKCGYCELISTCSDESLLSCLMCDDFVTIIDRLPYFEERVKIIDEQIKNATIPHDIEDLVNKKRLHLGFIIEILKLKSEKGEEANVTT